MFNSNPQGLGDTKANGTNVHSQEHSLGWEEEECTIPYSSTTNELDIHNSSISQEKSYVKLDGRSVEVQESKSFLSINIAPDDELSEEMRVSESEGVNVVLEVQPPMIINSDIVSESNDVESGDKMEVLITATTNVSCSADVQKVLNENMQRSDLLSTNLQPNEGQDVNDTYLVDDDSCDRQGTLLSVVTYAPNNGSEIASRLTVNEEEVTKQSPTLANSSSEISSFSSAKYCNLNTITLSELQENNLLVTSVSMDLSDNDNGVDGNSNDEMEKANASPSDELSNDDEGWLFPTVTDMLNHSSQHSSEEESILTFEDKETLLMHSAITTNKVVAVSDNTDDHETSPSFSNGNAEMGLSPDLLKNLPQSFTTTKPIKVPNKNNTFSMHSIPAVSYVMEHNHKTNADILKVQTFPTVADNLPQSLNEAEPITTLVDDNQTFSIDSTMHGNTNTNTPSISSHKLKQENSEGTCDVLSYQSLPRDDVEMCNTGTIGTSKLQPNDLASNQSNKEFSIANAADVKVTPRHSPNNLTVTATTNSASFAPTPPNPYHTRNRSVKYSKSGGAVTNHAAVKLQRNPAYVTVSYAAHAGAYGYEYVPLILEEIRQPNTTTSDTAVKLERNPAYMTVSYAQSRHSKRHK